MPDGPTNNEERPARTALVAVGVGLAVGVAAIAIVVSIIAIPLFALARFAEPGHGLDRPLIRNGLVRVAIPAGVILGTACGLAVARWYHRGGRIPTE